MTPHAHSLKKSRIALFFEHLAQRESFLSQSQGSQWSHISHLRYPLLFGLSGSACGPSPPSSSESEHALTHGSSSLLDSGSGSEMFCLHLDLHCGHNHDHERCFNLVLIPNYVFKIFKIFILTPGRASFRRTHTHSARFKIFVHCICSRLRLGLFGCCFGVFRECVECRAAGPAVLKSLHGAFARRLISCDIMRALLRALMRYVGALPSPHSRSGTMSGDIIFLDIDGVMNTRSSRENGDHLPTSECLKNLSFIMAHAYKPSIVLSSTWRLDPALLEALKPQLHRSSIALPILSGARQVIAWMRYSSGCKSTQHRQCRLHGLPSMTSTC